MLVSKTFVKIITDKAIPTIHPIPSFNKYNIPYDQIIMGKPWPGYGGFYVDDKSIRPSEFVNKTEEEIIDLLNKETSFVRSGKKQIL